MLFKKRYFLWNFGLRFNKMNIIEIENGQICIDDVDISSIGNAIISSELTLNWLLEISN